MAIELNSSDLSHSSKFDSKSIFKGDIANFNKNMVKKLHFNHGTGDIAKIMRPTMFKCPIPDHLSQSNSQGQNTRA